jgi:hypothetical protein
MSRVPIQVHEKELRHPKMQIYTYFKLVSDTNAPIAALKSHLTTLYVMVSSWGVAEKQWLFLPVQILSSKEKSRT